MKIALPNRILGASSLSDESPTLRHAQYANGPLAIALTAALLVVPAGASPAPAPLSASLAGGGVTPERQSAPPADDLARQVHDILGFEVGEEHRYVLGPEEALGRGETGMWSIRLDEIHVRNDGSPESLFALRHEWQAPQPVGDPPLRAITRVRSEGTLRVNAHGFPLFIHYETIRHLAGLGDEAYTVDYDLDEEHRRFDKSTTSDGVRWYQSIPVRRHDTVDHDTPEGLFVFLPAGPGCLDRYVATYEVERANPQPRSAATPSSNQPGVSTPVKVADNADCEESLFANPGLLNLAMPALWEAQGEREYVFFTPIGAVGKPEGGVVVGIPTNGPPIVPTGIGRGPGLGPMGGFPDRRSEGSATTVSTYHEVETIEFIDRVAVRVGERVVDGWRMETAGELGAVYVDDDGVVLRVDLPDVEGVPERFLRRLWPSEF